MDEKLSNTDVSMAGARDLNELGQHYFRQVGARIIDADVEKSRNFGYSVSISDDGLIVAVSGMCSTDAAVPEHFYRVKVYQKSNDDWIPMGQVIDSSDQTTEFLHDSRAHVSLSGDGTKLSVATVCLKERTNSLASTPEGSVRVYAFEPSNSEWFLHSTEYNGDAGAGATSYIGLKSSLNYDGSKIAIAMRYFDGPGGVLEENQGAVIACNVGDSSSCKTVAIGTTANEYLGSSVMISADSNPSCVAFGSVGTDNQNGNDSGSTSVYCDEDDSGNWSIRGTPLEGEAARDEFGFSVAISSDSTYVAVGAWKNDRDNANAMDDGGHVRVYKFDSNTGNYAQIGSDIDGERGRQNYSYYMGDFSGYSIALSDKRTDNILRVAIGAPNNEGGDYYNGQVRIFEYNTDSTNPDWTQVLDDIDGQSTRESAGRSIAMSKDGTRLIFGSPEYGMDSSGYYALGSAVVYDLTEYSAYPSSSPTESDSLSSVPSLSPSLSEKLITSTEQEMVFEGTLLLDDESLNHWKILTEETILEEFALENSTVTNVDIEIINYEVIEAHDHRRRHLETDGDHLDCIHIVYTMNLTDRGEEGEEYDHAMQKSVSTALESDGYVAALNQTYSTTGENAFASVTSVKTGELIDSFQIQTTYEKYDFSGNATWCIRSNGMTLGSCFFVRRCSDTDKLQVWSSASHDQLQLAAFPLNPVCMKTAGSDMVLDTCNIDADEKRSFVIEDFGTGTRIKQEKDKTCFVGVNTQREFQKLSIFENVVNNNSLNKWKVVHGKYSTATESWTVNP